MLVLANMDPAPHHYLRILCLNRSTTTTTGFEVLSVFPPPTIISCIRLFNNTHCRTTQQLNELEPIHSPATLGDFQRANNLLVYSPTHNQVMADIDYQFLTDLNPNP